jgi:hypothetical protein
MNNFLIIAGAIVCAYLIEYESADPFLIMGGIAAAIAVLIDAKGR